MVAAGSTMLSPTDTSAAHMSMFMSEARIQNTEMRMNLSKFGDKIDHLISKVCRHPRYFSFLSEDNFLIKEKSWVQLKNF